MQASIEHELAALGGHAACVVMRMSEGVPQEQQHKQMRQVRQVRQCKKEKTCPSYHIKA